ARTQLQEGYWVNPYGQAPPTLRDNLRRVQEISALRAAADLGFADPRLQFQVHMDLYDRYLKLHYLDLALDQFALAEQVFDGLPVPEDPKLLEGHRNQKKQIEMMRKQLEASVSQRKNDYNLNTASLDSMRKVRYALYAKHRVFNKENK